MKIIIALVSFIIGGCVGLVLGSIVNIAKESEKRYEESKKNK